MLDLNNKNTLFDLLAQGATIITPNNRLSAALLQQYFTYTNHKTVDKPACLPYSTFLINTYEQLNFLNPEQKSPLLLNNFQCQYLWQKMLKSDSETTYSDGLLKAVVQAWDICQCWEINEENQVFDYTPQTRKFQHWWQLFNKYLKKNNLICEQQLSTYLIKSNRKLFSQPTIWVCFDDFNPQQVSLQHYLQDNGIPQYRYDLKDQPNTSQILSAADNKEEYQQLISWLHSRLVQGEQRIGVVIPNLEQESRILERLLLSHFDPSLFNISLGQPLNTFSLVAHAFTWLQLDTKALNYNQAALILQSPYIGSAKKEFIARSHYLQESALIQEQNIPLQVFIVDLTNAAPDLCQLLNNIKAYPVKAPPEEWIQLFQQRLNDLGFPGDYGLNSENYQCFNRFKTVFDEFRQLTLINTSLSTTEAINALIDLTKNTIFQAQKINAPIQISGLLEASGCEFDSLWVMGLTDQSLPQKTNLSAFIPPHLQRESQMPHSVSSRELQFAKQTIQRLQRGSRHSVFSYPRLQGDNPNLPCSLITCYPHFKRLPLNIKINQSALITRKETYTVPLQLEEQISGGTSLLANQAKCPFKAFAEHRLKAKPTPSISDGLEAKEKGQIIHKIMELLWRNLSSQKDLLNLSPSNLDILINQAIDTALSPLQQIHPESFSALFQEIEYIRLKRLVLASLEWEKQRPPFHVTALEESYTVTLANLDFKVRVDRLDQVADKKWVIDYKSSLPASKPWNEDRPQEPQLLLYALLDEKINALLFMQLKTGQVISNGLSEEKQDIYGISTLKKGETWDEYRNKWQQQLTQLADEFQQGLCHPQPAHQSICQRCDFQNLCRYQV